MKATKFKIEIEFEALEVEPYEDQGIYASNKMFRPIRAVSTVYPSGQVCVYITGYRQKKDGTDFSAENSVTYWVGGLLDMNRDKKGVPAYVREIDAASHAIAGRVTL
jgi:hypothetical protein